MCAKKIEGVLTAMKVKILFRIQECWDTTALPPHIADIAKMRDKVYANNSIIYHLRELVEWGYVLETKSGSKSWGWRLSERGRDIITQGAVVETTGRGVVR